ncbi:PREDICTED: olfactory receptor 1C1 [Cercocebus atys]|uniref:olfactory receptor 1C1 n=1 Tax=Cercocebus atys TaxID=9531 RepID=UPI0005F4C7A9|nr:PREDICTED: olfactory receptor 1C1 [Cercocebus atys]
MRAHTHTHSLSLFLTFSLSQKRLDTAGFYNLIISFSRFLGNMEKRNLTVVREFVLLGLPSSAEQQHLLSVLFLCMYLATTLGNMLIIVTIGFDSRLHSPMYFFLSNLAFVDICFTSTTVPQMVVNILTGTKTISFAGCLSQLFFFVTFVNMDSLLLCVMAYDRYVAICHPLHYTATMNLCLCVQLMAGLWLVTYLHALLHTVLTARLSFCASNIIHHFFCDLNPLLQVSCSDISFNVMIIFAVGGLLAITPLVCILISYGIIFSTVLKITSTQGKQRAVSTCSCHLSVVVVFYGTAIAVYFSPSSSHTPESDSVSTIMYSVVAPMLNPFIYTIRNRDMKRGLQKMLFKCTVFQRNNDLSD